MTSRPFKWWLANVAVPFALVFAVVYYLTGRRDLFSTLSDVSLGQLALVSALVMAAHFINALEFGRLYRAVGVQMSVFENWMLFTAGQLGNHLPAQIGTLYRFRYLKRRHGLDIAKATAGYGANLMITILASGLVGLAGAIWLGLAESQWSVALIVGLSAFIIAGLAASVVRLPTSAADYRLARAWRSFAAGWKEIGADRTAAITVLFLELLRSLLTAWRLQLTFSWLGFDQPLAFFLVVGPTAALVTFVGFTPAGLGLRELSIGVITAELGRSFDDGLAGSTIDRAVSLLVVAVLGVVGFAYTSKQLRTHQASLARGPS